MQDKASFGLNRTAHQYRHVLQGGILQWQINPVKQGLQIEFRWFVDDQSQRPPFTVLTHVHHTAPEDIVLQTGHRDEKVMRQGNRTRIWVHAKILTVNAPPTYDLGLVWLRRDLRLDDNTALHEALQVCQRVQLVFVFDTALLEPLPRHDRRVAFIHQCVTALQSELRKRTRSAQTNLAVLHANAETAVVQLAQSIRAGSVFVNHDDEPYALRRDARVRDALAHRGIAWHSYKDHIVLERRELLTAAGNPYRVFTPYQRAWLERVKTSDIAERDCRALTDRCARVSRFDGSLPDLQSLGFDEPREAVPPHAGGRAVGLQLLNDFSSRIDRYQQTRDVPCLRGPSYLGTHLRFGTVSIRELLRLAMPLAKAGSLGAQTWVGELVWRDFFAQILSNFPHVATGCFKPEFDALQWEAGPVADQRFDAWCKGRTGYPFVDAGMRQLLQTGYMHNRLRMVTASFLVKHLGIDWRWGEAFFARHLMDFDLASNNGNWQWASSTGCDAQPYFRIFNPVAQSRKFDPQARFILRYVPELKHAEVRDPHAPWESWSDPAELTRVTGYPNRVVALEAGRARTLLHFGAIASRPPRSNHAPD